MFGSLRATTAGLLNGVLASVERELQFVDDGDDLPELLTASSEVRRERGAVLPQKRLDLAYLKTLPPPCGDPRQ